MVVTLMLIVKTHLVVSDAHVSQDSVAMEIFASMSTNVKYQIHVDHKDHDVSIHQAHTDVFVNKDTKVSFNKKHRPI